MKYQVVCVTKGSEQVMEVCDSYDHAVRRHHHWQRSCVFHDFSIEKVES